MEFSEEAKREELKIDENFHIPNTRNKFICQFFRMTQFLFRSFLEHFQNVHSINETHSFTRRTSIA